MNVKYIGQKSNCHDKATTLQCIVAVALNLMFVLLIAVVHRAIYQELDAHWAQWLYELATGSSNAYLCATLSLLIIVIHTLIAFCFWEFSNYKYGPFEYGCILLSLSTAAIVWDDSNWGFVFLLALMLVGIIVHIVGIRKARWETAALAIPYIVYASFLYILCYHSSYYMPFALLTIPSLLLVGIGAVFLIVGSYKMIREKGGRDTVK